MTTTPTGTPAWSGGSADPSDYGGHADKRNYQSIGRVNAQTDFDVSEFLRFCADLAAVRRVSAFAQMRLTLGSAGVAPTVHYYQAQPGTELPTFTPSGTTNGVLDIEWEDSYEDEYGVSADIDIQAVWAYAEGGSTWKCNWTRLSATKIRLTLTSGVYPASGKVFVRVDVG